MAVVDNLIAYRVLSMLVKPFNETDAYKLGIIDDKGNNLIRASDLLTAEQKNAYTYLHRLVFNLKKLLNKLPGGESRFKNIVAAFFLIKEAYATRSIYVSEDRLNRIHTLIESGVVFVDEQNLINEFFTINEDAVANVTGGGVSTNIPVIKPKRFARFKVNEDLYNKLAAGRATQRKLHSYLNLEDVMERQIYDYSRSVPNGVVIVHNGINEKAIQVSPFGTWARSHRSVRALEG